MLLQHIVFLQGNEAEIPLDMLKDQGEEVAIEYLLQWDYGEGEYHNHSCWGNSDTVYNQDDLILTYNERLGYIDLCRQLA